VTAAAFHRELKNAYACLVAHDAVPRLSSSVSKVTAERSAGRLTATSHVKQASDKNSHY
jgi:hypothetical protein